METIYVSDNQSCSILKDIVNCDVLPAQDAVPGGILILNSDKFDQNAGIQKAYVITCGLNSRATVTLSSMNKDNATVCLQREINDVWGNLVEPQEFPLNTGEIKNTDQFLTCAAACIATATPFEKLLEHGF